MREIIRDKGRLEHILDAIDKAFVWDTVRNYLPSLREQIKKIYDEEQGDSREEIIANLTESLKQIKPIKEGKIRLPILSL
jgi:hypothetical protein